MRRPGRDSSLIRSRDLWRPAFGWAGRNVAPFVVGAVWLLAEGPLRAGDGPELLAPLDGPTQGPPPRLVNPLRAPIISTPTSVRPPTLPSAPVGAVTAPPANPTAIISEPTTSVAATPNAVLAVPGLSVPRANSRLLALPPLGDVPVADGEPVRPRPEPLAEPGPTLDGPIEMPGLTSRDARGGFGAAAELAPIPDTFPTEPHHFDPLPGPSTRRPSGPSPAASRIEPTLPGSRSGTSAHAGAAPVRHRRFFGLFPGPVVIPPTALNTRPNAEAGRNAHPSSPDLDSQAAATVALQTRIEKQARSSVGDRVRSIEVRVSDKNATVQARGVKFYQKRGVRRSLEALPALSGLRSTIEVLD